MGLCSVVERRRKRWGIEWTGESKGRAPWSSWRWRAARSGSAPRRRSATSREATGPSSSTASRGSRTRSTPRGLTSSSHSSGGLSSRTSAPDPTSLRALPGAGISRCAKNLEIMNLGEDSVDGSGAVAAAIQSTIDDPDPYLNGIKNQAGDEESDEEVLLLTS
ncbi:uncharacterized protein LOC124672838 [Lolium rigidum]|uniref:uncharacterized protein LOC124672838 n=1 Tax=Lolium rigidum TaxID=89674 RepID=UPI001F5D79E6|nr:uncharacterized protein LOC124672838 [Lolium rigidum]